jgi:hypothetical protein
VSTGAAIVLVGAALVLVHLVNKQREATTAANVAAIKSTIYDPSKGLSITDQLNIGVTAVATYFGGPSAGIAYAKQVH